MIFRLIIGVPLGAVVTLALFLLMRELITNRDSLLPDEIETVAIDITRAQRDEDSRDNRELQRPDQEDQPPPPPPMDTRTERPDLGGLNVALPAMEMDIGGNMGPIDGNIQPLVRVMPEYPMRAAERGTQGETCIIFDVTPEGTTTNAQIDTTTSSMFNRSAMRALAGFRYQPKVENGQPVMRQGVRYCFEFVLQDEGR